MSPKVCLPLSRRLMDHVEANGLGQVYAGDTGFTLARSPDTVRAPDIAFIRRDRVPGPEPPGYPDLAPDLAVEVLSPSNRPAEMLAKVADWLNSGTSLVWVLDPERRQARVYRQDGTEALVPGHEALSGEDLLPGFTCALDAILYAIGATSAAESTVCSCAKNRQERSTSRCYCGVSSGCFLRS